MNFSPTNSVEPFTSHSFISIYVFTNNMNMFACHAWSAKVTYIDWKTLQRSNPISHTYYTWIYRYFSSIYTSRELLWYFFFISCSSPSLFSCVWFVRLSVMFASSSHRPRRTQSIQFRRTRQTMKIPAVFNNKFECLLLIYYRCICECVLHLHRTIFV